MEIVDAELIEDKEYASMGENPANRAKALPGKLRSPLMPFDPDHYSPGL